MRNGSGIMLSFEAADAITLATLIEARDRMVQENKLIEQREEDGEEIRTHQMEDYRYNSGMINYVNKVIGFFGGE
jgi:hypothetical protein